MDERPGLVRGAAWSAGRSARPVERRAGHEAGDAGEVQEPPRRPARWQQHLQLTAVGRLEGLDQQADADAGHEAEPGEVEGGPPTSAQLGQEALADAGDRCQVEVAEVLCSAYGLRDRERDVVGLVLRGESNRSAARALGISEHTVKEHLKSVFAKVGVLSRAELAARLLHEQYLPRRNSGVPAGSAGWFRETA